MENWLSKFTTLDMYGAKGWMTHHNTDLWRTTGSVDGAFWGASSNGGGWLSQPKAHDGSSLDAGVSMTNSSRINNTLWN